MGCGGYKGWTKFITIFTIIFCLVHNGVQIFALYISDNINFITDITLFFLILTYTYYSLMVVSVVINFLWLFSNINVLVNLGGSEIQQSLVTSYIMWDIAAFASFIIDTLSIVIYGMNYSKYVRFPKEYMYMLIIPVIFVIRYLFNLCAIIGMIIITTMSKKNLGKQPKKRVVPLKPPKPVLKKPTREAYLEENNIDRVRDWHNHYENSKNVQPNPNYAPSYIPRLNEMPINNEPNLNSPNNDYSHNHALPGSNTNVLVNGVPSGTLRRQLPWSYMPNPNELPHMQPRKPVPVPTPYVPAPDYYLKNPKSISRRDFNQPGWSQHL